MKKAIIGLLVASNSFGWVIYDGETAPYSNSVQWDGNGSMARQSINLKLNINSVNYWGAAGYVFNNWEGLDFSRYKYLTFNLKASPQARIGVQLHDKYSRTSNVLRFDGITSFSPITLPLDKFSGIELAKVTTMIVSINTKELTSTNIDIDNIAIEGITIPPAIQPVAIETGTMRVKGRHLFDACNKKMIIKGPNHMTVYTDWVDVPRDGMPMFSEISKSGANAVRIIWSQKENTKPEELDRAIANAAMNKLIPVVTNIDHTCEWSNERFEQLISFWTSGPMLAVLKKHQKYLVLNFANEMGGWSLTQEEFESKYIMAIGRIRQLGLNMPIMIDAPGCGQDENMILKTAHEIINGDPVRNVIFGVHIYWYSGGSARVSRLTDEMSQLNIPVVISEFAPVSFDCKIPIPYVDIVNKATSSEIGWMPWSWDSANSCPILSMTRDNTEKSLWGWARDIVIDLPNSWKETAEKSSCF